MKTQNSKVVSKGNKSESKNASKKQVNNAAVATRRVETRDMWEVIFNHSVALIAAYAKGIKVEEPRKGFAFGAIAEQPHSRAYAQSLIGGFLTSKAGKVLKDFDDLAKRESREKIAIAILLDTKLAKDGQEGARRILGKAEPKREKALAEAVLTELTKPEPKPTTPKGGKDGKSEEKKPATPKGSKGKSETKPTTPKGGKGKTTKATK